MAARSTAAGMALCRWAAKETTRLSSTSASSRAATSLRHAVSARACSTSSSSSSLPPPPVTPSEALSIPLQQELPGIPKLSPAANLPSPVTRVTQLPNGLRVASEETYGQVACVGLFLDSGSKYESGDTIGANHFLETLSFKSTTSQTTEDILKTCMAHGIGLSANASREHMVYRVDCLRGSLETAVSLLADTAQNPLFTPAEVAEAKKVAEFQHLEVESNPQVMIQEALHWAAFGDTPIGRPLMCPKDRIEGLTSDMLHAFRSAHYTGKRAVLAAAGVEHEHLLECANKYLADMPAGDGDVFRPDIASYTGGDVRMALPEQPMDPNPLTHVAIAFPTRGWNSDDVVAECVLDTLLGGGSSFSAGGPGKGMYSRLYREVLNQYLWVESASAFSLQMGDVGLAGIYGAAAPADAGNLIQVIVNHLIRLAHEPVLESELSRARNQLRSAVMMNLELRSVLCEDVGRQLLMTDKRVPPQELCDQIDAVTATDLQRLAQNMMAHPPAVAVLGDLSKVQAAEDIAAVFETNRPGPAQRV